MEFEEIIENKEKKKGIGKYIIMVVILVVISIGGWFGYNFYIESTNYYVTENARVATDIVFLTTSTPGTLERFYPYQGMTVYENEILGWVEGAPSFRLPIDGVVLKTYVTTNELVGAGEPLAAIANLEKMHIQVNVEEDSISRVSLGQEVTFTIDALGDRIFTGYVAEISSVTDSALSGNLMTYNTGGKFTKVKQLISVKINVIDDIELENLIGLNAKVRIPLN